MEVIELSGKLGRGYFGHGQIVVGHVEGRDITFPVEQDEEDLGPGQVHGLLYFLELLVKLGRIFS